MLEHHHEISLQLSYASDSSRVKLTEKAYNHNPHVFIPFLSAQNYSSMLSIKDKINRSCNSPSHKLSMSKIDKKCEVQLIRLPVKPVCSPTMRFFAYTLSYWTVTFQLNGNLLLT